MFKDVKLQSKLKDAQKKFFKNKPKFKKRNIRRIYGSIIGSHMGKCYFENMRLDNQYKEACLKDC